MGPSGALATSVQVHDSKCVCVVCVCDVRMSHQLHHLSRLLSLAIEGTKTLHMLFSLLETFMLVLRK